MKNDDRHNPGTSVKVLILVLMVSILIGCIAGLLIYTLFIPPMIGSDSGQTTRQLSTDDSDQQATTDVKASQDAAATTTAAVTATTAAIAEETESAVETTSMDINDLFDKAEENGAMQEDYAKEEEEEAEDIEEADDDDYILPYSSERELTEDDLAGLSARDLQLARNEIYARHGRGFNTDWIQEYFNGKSWYERTHSAEEFDKIEEETLSSLEKRNVDFIKAHEQ